MVFDLATTCKEWLDDNNVDPQVRERQRLLQEEEERERRRQEGTPVTPETFARWIAEWERLHPPVEIKRHKPTGRQLFESNAEMVYSDAAFTEQGLYSDFIVVLIFHQNRVELMLIGVCSKRSWKMLILMSWIRWNRKRKRHDNYLQARQERSVVQLDQLIRDCRRCQYP